MKDDVIVIPGFNKKIPAAVVSEAKQLIDGIKKGTFPSLHRTDQGSDREGSACRPAST